MPTLFERISSGLEGNNLSIELTVQVDQLGAIATLITDLIENPPESIDDLGGLLNELPLPDLQVGGSFATTLSEIQAAVPTDLSSITGDLITDLTSLSGAIDVEVIQSLNQALAAMLAVYQLTQIDLRCEDSSAPATGAANGGGSPGPTIDVPGGTTETPEAGEPEAENAEAGDSPTTIESVTTQANDLLAILESVPSPLNVETLLDWLRQTISSFDRSQPLPLPLPILNEVLDPLETLATWKGMMPAEIQDHMLSSLQDLNTFIRSTVNRVMSDLVADLSAIATQFQASALAQIADDLTAGLTQLRTAVNSGSLAGTASVIAQVTARLDQYDALRPVLQSNLLIQLPDLNERLQALADDLADQMNALLVMLQPRDTLGGLENILPAGSNSPTVMLGELDALARWIEDLVNQLDLTAVEEPLSSAANAAQGLVDSLEQNLTEVSIQVSALFGEVESLLDQVDLQALTDQVTTAIEDFATQLQQQLESLFQPVRDAVSQVVQAISGGIDQFDPAAIVDALRQAIQTLTGVLETPEVVAALAEIRNAIAQATQQLQQLSFQPLTDQVVAAIDELTAVLRQIDTSVLDNSLKLALQAALAVLPEDLTPVTDPLIQEFADLVEQGPIPLLETVKEQPQRLLDQVRSFEPASLVGDVLTRPYDQLLQQMQAFQPSRLLEPVTEELEKLKDRLRQDANPGAAIQLLEEPFNDLLQTFDQLQPGDIVQPLEAAITEAMNGILEALPIDEVFEQVDQVLQTVESLVTASQAWIDVLDALRSLLDGFSNASNQVNAWINDILDKIEAMEVSSLQPRLADVAAAVEQTKSAALMSQLETAIAPLLTTLNALSPRTKLAAMVQAQANFPRAALVALPDSSEKAALLAALDRFTPLNPVFAAPYQALDAHQQQLVQTQSELPVALLAWDSRYHPADGILADFNRTDATAAELRQWVQAAVEPQFVRPFSALFSLAESLQSPVASLLSIFQDLVSDLQGKLTDLLLGPNSLGGIRDALQQLVQRLQDLNLDFLREGLQDVFDRIRDKLEVISPTQLREVVETAFEAMLSTLTMDQLIPPSEVAMLDADYAEVIGKLEDLSPETLVTQVVQPEFEETVIPLLDTFDLTELFTALIERLRSLDEELKAELERVNQAYQAMRDAIPPISIDIDIDVGISL